MFMVGSEMEFGSFFQKEDGVYGHEEESENPDYTE
jgi:hypothetical protein